MKRFLVTLLFTIFTIGIYAQESTTSTYYLIRHAEKDRSDKANKNPDLTEKGQKEPSNGARCSTNLVSMLFILRTTIEH